MTERHLAAIQRISVHIACTSARLAIGHFADPRARTFSFVSARETSSITKSSSSCGTSVPTGPSSWMLRLLTPNASGRRSMRCGKVSR